jgi:uncharacterized protein (DUF2249 family)
VSTPPITAADRVHDVLARGESLIEVFVRHSAHFAKLRNAALRRTMARLVTVEQAAAIAGVPAEALVRDLNRAIGVGDSVEPSPREPAPDAGAPDAAPRRPEGAPEREIDVREDLRAGREPFPRIMAAVAALADGELLRLRAPFEPAPLYTVLGKRGYAHETSRHAPDDWSVWFWRGTGSRTPRPGDAEAEMPEAPAAGDGAMEGEQSERWLDVRGLEPPEPMERTLAALESLPPGATLVQVNVRVPRFLLPILAERGFDYDIDETRADRVLVRIRRSA